MRPDDPLSRMIVFAIALSFTQGRALAADLSKCGNRPQGSAVVRDVPWNSLENPGWVLANGGGLSISAEAAATPMSGPNVLQYRFRKGMPGGAGEGRTYTFLPLSNEVYVCYSWKPSDPFPGHPSNINKISYLWSHQNLNNVILVMLGQSGGPPYHLRAHVNTVGRNNLGVNSGHAPPQDKGILFIAQSPQAIVLGKWHVVELYVKMNTATGQHNGVVRAWLDGVQFLNATNVDFNHEPWQSFEHNPTWGGGGSIVPFDGYYWTDHTLIATGGSGSGPAPPPPPPPTTPPPPPAAANPGSVTDLAVTRTGADSATLSFTQVSDGTGAAAKYIVRASSSGALWGGAPDVTQGTCAAPLQGTAATGPLTCTVAGLLPSIRYEFQMIAFRNTMNVDAVFGGLSNVASATTASAGASTDINGDGNTNITDVQLAVNQAVGLGTCGSADVDRNGACNIADVQRIVNAAFGL